MLPNRHFTRQMSVQTHKVESTLGLFNLFQKQYFTGMSELLLRQGRLQTQSPSGPSARARSGGPSVNFQPRGQDLRRKQDTQMCGELGLAVVVAGGVQFCKHLRF